MVKELRSLIHERFPLDLRVQIELLSRRRDISNGEKQEELITMLRKNNIDVVPLGPGTNRYAFKLDGFVVKVATDHDGKIDNMKEFKMAKVLFPYVTKIYEISENGTLLVAEYIQPFASFTEMLQYKDRIIEILNQLSSLYLIGDVGVVAKNYSNWGTRVGSKEPVCLDFAYVYKVSSQLFMCPKCGTGMLQPSADFSYLVCGDSRCGKKVLFEEIRMKIGNDMHRHEIGNLAEVGYPLNDSHVITTLDHDRSGYLHVPVEKTQEEKEEEIVPLDNFVASPTGLKNEEEFIMKKEDLQRLIQASVVVIDPVVKENKQVEKKQVEDQPVKKSTSVVAFTGSFSTTEKETEKSMDVNISDPVQQVVTVSEPDQQPVEKAEVKSTPVVKVEPAPVVSKSEKPSSEKIDNNSAEEAEALGNKCKSLASSISSWCHENDLFSEVDVPKKTRFFSGDFYKSIELATFYALYEMVGIKEEYHRPEGGKPAFSVFSRIGKPKSEETLKFINGFVAFKPKGGKGTKLEKYREEEPGTGIDRRFLDKFSRNLAGNLKKKNIQPAEAASIAATVANAIEAEWCTPINDTDKPKESADAATAPAVEVAESVSEEPVNVTDTEESKESNNESIETETPVDDDDDSEDEDEDDVYHLSVEIYPEDDISIIKLKCGEVFSLNTFPFYTDLNKIDGTTVKTAVDERNGYWSWLTDQVPDLMFTTTSPEKWLKVNNEESSNGSVIRIVILANNFQEEGTYLMGVFMITSINIVDESFGSKPVEDNETLTKLNNLFVQFISGTPMSHLNRSVSETSCIHSEAYIEAILLDEDENETDSVSEMDDLTSAAIDVLNSINDDTKPNDSDGVEEVSIQRERDRDREEIGLYQPIRRDRNRER